MNIVLFSRAKRIGSIVSRARFFCSLAHVAETGTFAETKQHIESLMSTNAATRDVSTVEFETYFKNLSNTSDFSQLNIEYYVNSMQKMNLNPNTNILDSILQGCLRDIEEDETEMDSVQLADYFWNLFEKRYNIAPNAPNYINIILLHHKTNNFAQCKLYLLKLVDLIDSSDNNRIDLSNIAKLFDSFSKNAKTVPLMGILHKTLTQNNIAIKDINIYNCLIGGYNILGREPITALGYFEGLVKNNAVTPDLTTLNLLCFVYFKLIDKHCKNKLSNQLALLSILEKDIPKLYAKYAMSNESEETNENNMEAQLAAHLTEHWTAAMMNSLLVVYPNQKDWTKHIVPFFETSCRFATAKTVTATQQVKATRQYWTFLQKRDENESDLLPNEKQKDKCYWIDLHGYSRNIAKFVIWYVFKYEDLDSLGYKWITIITGKGKQQATNRKS